MKWGRLAVVGVVLALLPAAAADAQTRPVLIVGNNWEGTADVLDVPSYERLRRISVVPDLAARQAENLLPQRLPIALFVRTLVGEGHDQMVDDMYASKDGRTLFVSRPSFDDVVAIDFASGKIVWRTVLTGVRADHMAISPDGARLAVSTASLVGASVVDVIDTATGKIAGTFPSGDTPHENNYSRDGSRIFHASIGRIYTPGDDPALDALKGERVFEVVDARTLKVLKKWNMADKLAEFGRPNMSAAVRPMALSPDEKQVYFQVSFFHGFVEFDLEREKVTRVKDLPLSDATPASREEYILDSAHHGIAMSGDGKKLCIAGTMSNYAAIVHRDDFSYRIHPLGARTYWSTTSADGRYCYVSVAGDDTMSIISYASEEEVARVPVGDHPQRARTADVSTDIFGAVPATRRHATRLTLAARAEGRQRVRLRGRLVGVPAHACRGRVTLQLRRGTTTVARGSAPLGRSCRFSDRLRVAGRGRVLAIARFAGTAAVFPQRSAGATVQVR
jgi:DNA-binding beta-propeller fold protein YncE